MNEADKSCFFLKPLIIQIFPGYAAVEPISYQPGTLRKSVWRILVQQQPWKLSVEA